MRAMTAIDSTLVLHPDDASAAEARVAGAAASATVPAATRQWTALAVMSLVVAGLLSLAVVIGRIPVVSNWIGDPLFFKRCLVVHVDLALLTWFYTFIAGAAGLRVPCHGSVAGRIAPVASGTGMALMLAGATVPGAMPVLSNYIPVIDHALFLGGLALFFAGVLLFFIHNLLTAPVPRAGVLPEDAATGIMAAGVAVALAAATWVAARTGLPEGLDAWTRAEFSGWGAGHVLQVANVSAMLAVWLWLLCRATGRQVLTVKQSRVLFSVLLLPHFVMPLLTWRGTLNQLYVDGATTLMRWGIFPVVVAVMSMSRRNAWLQSASRRASRSRCSASPSAR
jgi:cytochrome c oxidase subunit 1